MITLTRTIKDLNQRLIHRRRHHHHQVIQVEVKTLYVGILIGLLILIPSWKYFENANYHWTIYLLSFATSRLYLPVFLIYLLRENKLTWAQIIVNHFGIILFAIVCFLYFPSILSDMRYTDRYDWFMINGKIIVSFICVIFVIGKIFKK
jgi:hypothetical protein